VTIEITRQGGTFLYRQRADEPTVIESRPGYRGGRWAFVARYDTEAEARRALMNIAKQANNLESGTK
jgi:hypothetical protein